MTRRRHDDRPPRPTGHPYLDLYLVVAPSTTLTSAQRIEVARDCAEHLEGYSDSESMQAEANLVLLVELLAAHAISAEEALTRASRLVTAAQNLSPATSHVRRCARLRIARISAGIDPTGTNDVPIRECLDEVGRMDGAECLPCAIRERALVDLKLGRPDAAAEATRQLAALPGEPPASESPTTPAEDALTRAEISGRLGGWRSAEQATSRALPGLPDLPRTANLRCRLLSVQSVARGHLRESARASESARRAVDVLRSSGETPSVEALLTLACALREVGDLDGALSASAEALERLDGKGWLFDEARAHVEYCRCLSAKGSLTPETKEAARRVLCRLQDPGVLMAGQAEALISRPDGDENSRA